MANLSNINGKFVVEQTTGYVGVGTTDPSYPIEVLNASAEIALNASGGSTYRIQSDSASNFIIRKEGVGDRLVINSAGNSTFAGSVTVASANIGGKLSLTANGTFVSNGSTQFYRTATNGLNIVPTTGSVNDFELHNGSGQGVFHIPTGTQNATFAGDITLGGNILLNGGVLYKNSGSIEIKAENIRIKGVSTNENIAGFNENGSVQLFYDNVEKFATTSTGISVLGTSSTFAGQVSVGNYAIPSDHQFQIAHLGQSYARFALTNSQTGNGSSDGLIFQMENLNSIIKNQENGSLAFGTNGRETDLYINSSGSINIGSRRAALPSNFGYSSSYKVLILGSSGTNYQTDAVTLSLGVDVTGNPSGAFNGNGREIIIRNEGSFISPNAANNGYNNIFSWNSSGQPYFANNVGIGTTSPTEKLSVSGNIELDDMPANGTRYLMTNETSTGTGRLNIQAGGGSAAYGGGLSLIANSHASKPGWVIAGISSGAGAGATEGRFVVNTHGLGTGTDIFTVLRTGNVGIGTTSVLDYGVAGQVTNVQISNSNYTTLTHQTTNSTANWGVWRSITRYNGVYQIQAMNDAGTGEVTALEINRSGTTITQVLFPNGNVGIGTTSPWTKLAVSGTTASNSPSIGRNSTSTTVWTTILTFTGASAQMYSVLLGTGENNNNQMWRVSGSTLSGTCYFTILGDSGHAHSKDAEFRLSSGVLQYKNISYTTNRVLYVFDVVQSGGGSYTY